MLKEILNDDVTANTVATPRINLNQLSQTDCSNEQEFSQYLANQMEQSVESNFLQNEMENFWNSRFEFEEENFFTYLFENWLQNF